MFAALLQATGHGVSARNGTRVRKKMSDSRGVCIMNDGDL